jgi:hypothetical protein
LIVEGGVLSARRSIVFAVVVVLLVGYLAVARPDVQASPEQGIETI